MSTFLLPILAVSILCFFVSFKYFTDTLAVYIMSLYNMMDEDMILHKIHNAVESFLGEWAAKPIVGCPVCMPSFYIILPMLGATLGLAVFYSSISIAFCGSIFAVFTGIVVSGKIYIQYSTLNKDKSLEDYYDKLLDQLE